MRGKGIKRKSKLGWKNKEYRTECTKSICARNFEFRRPESFIEPLFIACSHAYVIYRRFAKRSINSALISLAGKQVAAATNAYQMMASSFL